MAKVCSNCHTTPSCALHWLRITEHIEYKLLSLTCKVLTTTQPPYLQNIISVQRPRNTRSSSLITLARPPTSSSLKITDRSFRYASSCLWNQLPFISPSTSFWYQFRHSFTHHFFLFCFTTLLIHNSLSFTPGLKPNRFTNPQ